MLRLDALLDKALQGSGSAVLITGDAGIGKTALASEFLRRARLRQPEMTLCRGRCVEQYGTGEAYLPFLDALGRLLAGRGRDATTALLRTYAPTWCLQLPAIADAPEAREALLRQTLGATKERMLREMGDLFEAAAANALMIGWLEDLQWSDTSSLDLVRHLVNRIGRQRTLILMTARPADLEARPQLKAFVLDLRAHQRCHELGLGPLSESQVADYLDARFVRHRFPPGLAALMHAKTEGHPLFLASLTRFLEERGDIALDDGTWLLSRPLSEADFEAPVSVRSMVKRKLEGLDEHDRGALEHASVLGREFLSTVLARILEVDEVPLEERLRRLDRVHRMVDTLSDEELPDGSLATRYRFTHALYQELLYSDLGSKRRALMHRRAAEQLGALYGAHAPRIAAQLALHLEQARQFEAAVKCLAQAGDNAAALYSYAEACDYYARAMAVVAGKLPPGEQAQPSLLLCGKRGGAHLAMGRFGLAAADYTQMLERARAEDAADVECQALSGLCNSLFFSLRLDEMAVRAEQAMRAAERSGSEPLRIEATLLIAQILQEQGSLEECKELLDDAVRRARSAGHRRALLPGLAYRGCVHYWQSEFVAAEAALVEALELARELREGWLFLPCLQFLGLARGGQGRMSDALAALQEGIEMGRRNGDHFWLPRLASHMGWIYRELQDFESAVAHDREGLELARRDGVEQAEASALLNLCIDCTRASRLREAEQQLSELEARHSRAHWFGWLYGIRLENARAELRLALGDEAGAREAAQRLLLAASRQRATSYVLTARQILAEAAGEGRAEVVEQLAAALSELGESKAPLAAWRAHAALARLRHASGDRGSAQRAYACAAAIVGRIADGVRDGALRATFMESRAVREVLRGAA